MTLSIRVMVAGVFLLMLYIIYVTAHEAGYAQGVADTTKQQYNSEKLRFEAVLSGIENLTVEANARSLLINESMTKWIVSNNKIIGDIRYELSDVSSFYNDCNATVNVMQQLESLRIRANKAAATGFNDSLPASSSTN